MFNFLKNKVYLMLDNPERKNLSRVKFTEALENSYRRGYQTAEASAKENYSAREQDLMDEYGILLASKDIELGQANRSINDLKEQLKDAQKAYREYYHETIANKKLVAQIAVEIRRLFNTSGDIYKSFITIQDSAQDHFKLMLKQDSLNRSLLGISPIPDEMNIQKSIEAVTLTDKEAKDLVEDINILKALTEKDD